MRCKKCGEENASAKRCCSNCGAFLEGYTFNNVTGKFGYRKANGDFVVLEKDSDEYTQGYRQALLDIRKEINDKTAQGYKFPLLHIFDWIDRKLGLKE